MEHWPPRTLQDLELVVREKLEETSVLEFKRQLPPSGQNDDLVKDISAMANTDGGVILYGITESDGAAEALHAFEITGVAERVTEISVSQIDEGLVLDGVTAIPTEDDPSKGFLVVEVPQSPRRPHFVRGAAWGRSPRHNFPLSRRQIGEMFAQMEGFAQEFGLVQTSPGRLRAEATTEPMHGSSSLQYHIRLENDGDSDVFGVTCRWAESATSPPSIVGNQLPIERVPFHSNINLRVSQVRTHNIHTLVVAWSDGRGHSREERWPLIWG